MLVEGHADERATDLYNLELASRRITSVSGFLDEHGLVGIPLHTAAFGERVPATAGGDPAAGSRTGGSSSCSSVTWWSCRPARTGAARAAASTIRTCRAAPAAPRRPIWGSMIDNPSDLARGCKPAPASGIHAAEGIERYRTGAVPSCSNKESETDGHRDRNRRALGRR